MVNMLFLSIRSDQRTFGFFLILIVLCIFGIIKIVLRLLEPNCNKEVMQFLVDKNYKVIHVELLQVISDFGSLRMINKYFCVVENNKQIQTSELLYEKTTKKISIATTENQYCIKCNKMVDACFLRCPNCDLILKE